MRIADGAGFQEIGKDGDIRRVGRPHQVQFLRLIGDVAEAMYDVALAIKELLRPHLHDVQRVLRRTFSRCPLQVGIAVLSHVKYETTVGRIEPFVRPVMNMRRRPDMRRHDQFGKEVLAASLLAGADEVEGLARRAEHNRFVRGLR